MARADQTIKGDLIDELFWDFRVDAEQVTVEVEDGKVILSGPVPSKYSRTRAYNAAAFTPGMVEVDIFVTSTVGESSTV